MDLLLNKIKTRREEHKKVLIIKEKEKVVVKEKEGHIEKSKTNCETNDEDIDLNGILNKESRLC